jgi:tetratricopeptide (TPR) repeat protein
LIPITYNPSIINWSRNINQAFVAYKYSMKNSGFISFITIFISIATCAQGPNKEKINDYFQNQQYEDAVDYLNPFYQKDSGNLLVLNSLGYAFYMSDEKDKSKIYYERIFKADSNNISANQYLANIEIADNQYEAAKSFVFRLTHINPARSSYFRILASIYKKNRQEDSARFYYEYAYRLSPADNKNIAAYADILINDSNYLRADSILKVGLAKDSTNISFLKLLFQSSYDSKNFPGMIPPGEKLIAWGELPVPILSKLVYAYYYLKKYNDCISLCHLMDSNLIADEAMFYYESMCWAKLNNPLRSNELLEKCLHFSISQTSELYYYNLGRNNESLGNYKRAIGNYDTAYYLFKNPLMLYYGGRVYDAHLRNYRMAKKYYSKYLAAAKFETGEEIKLYRFVKSRYTEIH